MLVPLMNATFMARLTRRSDGETTRNRRRAGLRALAAGTALLTLAGCATPGPNHLYLADPADPGHILDRAAPGIETRDVPSFLQPADTLLGLAYDPFTDHLFLRLAPGNRFRVVDRPDRSIKYAFTADEVPATGGGDIAIRSLDRHLFLGHPAAAAILEITLHGRFVRRIPLAGLEVPPGGLAYDQRRELIYVLAPGHPRTVAVYDRSGARQGTIALDRPVRTDVLAYDSPADEFYAREAATGRISVFDRQGRRVRTLAAPAPAGAMSFDVGPRSFLRLF